MTARIGAPTAERARRGGLAILLTGQLMAAIDASIVNVAAPSIGADLQTSGAVLVLAVSGYSIAYAMLLITGARLGHDYGQRRLFRLGLASFTAASLACGLAPSGVTLVVARLAQGAAAAAMTPQVLSMIQLRYQGRERARALGLYASVISLGTVAGQVLGGLIASADLFGTSWRLVFLINVPVGILLVASARHALAPAPAATAKRQLDLIGVALCSTAALLVLLPLAMGHEYDWRPWTFVSLGCGVAVAVAAAAHMRALARDNRDPLVHPLILGDGRVRLGLSSIFLGVSAYIGFLFTGSVYLQSGLGFSALRSGLTFVPYGAGLAIGSLVYPRLRGSVRARFPIAALTLLALSYGLLGLVDRAGSWHLLSSEALLAAAGIGFGSAFSPMITRTVAHVPRTHVHDASGVLGTTVQLAAAAGVTALGSLFLGSGGASGGGYERVTAVLVVLAFGAAILAGAALRASTKAARAR